MVCDPIARSQSTAVQPSGARLSSLVGSTPSEDHHHTADQHAGVGASGTSLALGRWQRQRLCSLHELARLTGVAGECDPSGGFQEASIVVVHSARCPWRHTTMTVVESGRCIVRHPTQRLLSVLALRLPSGFSSVQSSSTQGKCSTEATTHVRFQTPRVLRPKVCSRSAVQQREVGVFRTS